MRVNPLTLTLAAVPSRWEIGSIVDVLEAGGPLSEDAHRILDAFKDGGVLVGQWLDDRLIRSTVFSAANRSSALQQLADVGYVRIHEDNRQFALTDLGNQVINGETYSRQNWKPWRPSSDRG